jgi:hypothetical protein
MIPWNYLLKRKANHLFEGSLSTEKEASIRLLGVSSRGGRSRCDNFVAINLLMTPESAVERWIRRFSKHFLRFFGIGRGKLVKVPSPDSENGSPDNESASPDSESASPDNESASPDNESASPDNESASPDNESASPDNESD